MHIFFSCISVRASRPRDNRTVSWWILKTGSWKLETSVRTTAHTAPHIRKMNVKKIINELRFNRWPLFFSLRFLHHFFVFSIFFHYYLEQITIIISINACVLAHYSCFFLLSARSFAYCVRSIFTSSNWPVVNKGRCKIPIVYFIIMVFVLSFGRVTDGQIKRNCMSRH